MVIKQHNITTLMGELVVILGYIHTIFFAPFKFANTFFVQPLFGNTTYFRRMNGGVDAQDINVRAKIQYHKHPAAKQRETFARLLFAFLYDDDDEPQYEIDNRHTKRQPS